MKKYMTREQVVADFNYNFSDLLKNLTLEDIEHFWYLNLDLLTQNKKISQKQRNIWVFNKKDLEFSF
tara:strand:+ start:4956 stop:5156 length:201 start_codon:yes stop_codon:yes gene_type:complete